MKTIETITIDDFKANTKEWLIDKLESMSKDNALQSICNLHDELHNSEYLNIYKENTMEHNINSCKIKKISAICFKDRDFEDKVELLLSDNYEIKEENNKYYAIRKKPKYPKTFEECCKILGCKADYFFTNFSCNNCDVEISDYEDKIDDLLQNLRKLIYYRKAYWKIAGEQMGLGKPWEPNLQDKKQTKYVITNVGNNIAFELYAEYNGILAFPTEEMRNIFYENFKELIESVKELL